MSTIISMQPITQIIAWANISQKLQNSPGTIILYLLLSPTTAITHTGTGILNQKNTIKYHCCFMGM